MWSTLFRCLNAVLALVLVAAMAPCISLSDTWSQRLRFIGSIGIGVLLAHAHLASLGRPWNWYLPALTLVAGALAAGSVLFILEQRRARAPK